MWWWPYPYGWPPWPYSWWPGPYGYGYSYGYGLGMPPYPAYAYWPGMAKEEERRMLEAQAEALRWQLEQLERRLKELKE